MEQVRLTRTDGTYSFVDVIGGVWTITPLKNEPGKWKVRRNSQFYREEKCFLTLDDVRNFFASINEEALQINE